MAQREDTARRKGVCIVLTLIIVGGALTSGWGLRRQGIMLWDEGCYFDEARFVIEAARAMRGGAAAVRQETHGLPPRMGRPLNVVINVLAMSLGGVRPWMPAAVAGLFGVGCLALTCVLGARVAGDGVGLAASGLLSLSPYFLSYRRVGLPEAGSAFLALLVLLCLIHWRQSGEKRPWRNTLLLALLMGAAFTLNMRLGVLLACGIVCRVLWAPLPRTLGARAAHLLIIVGGIGFWLVAFELPYWLLARAMPGVPPVESYWAQLGRFLLTQQGMGRPSLVACYLAPLVFLAYFDLPAFLLGILGIGLVVTRKPQRQSEAFLLLACLGGQLLALGAITPFARYLAWTLPLWMIGAALGVQKLAQIKRPALRWSAWAVISLAVIGNGLWRGYPWLLARGQMAQAAEWLREHGSPPRRHRRSQPAACLLSSGRTFALIYSGSRATIDAAAANRPCICVARSAAVYTRHVCYDSGGMR